MLVTIEMLGDRIGELAALGTALCWSLTSIYFTIATRHLGSMSLNRVRLALAVVFLGTLHFATEGAFWPRAEAWRWVVLGASGILGLTVGDTLLFHAFRAIGPRKSMILMSTVPILSAGLAFALLGESIGIVESVGILAVVTGVVVVVAERSPGPDSRPGSLGRGVAAALGAAAAQAISLVIVKRGMADGFSSVAATWMRMIVAGAVAWGLAVSSRNLRPSLAAFRDRRAMPAALAGSVLGPFLGVWLSVFAVANAPVGVASGLMALVPVFVIPWVRVFFGERVTARGFAGTVVAVGGAVMLLAT